MHELPRFRRRFPNSDDHTVPVIQHDVTVPGSAFDVNETRSPISLRAVDVGGRAKNAQNSRSARRKRVNTEDAPSPQRYK